MGLFINYELWLPPNTTANQSLLFLESLRKECESLGAARVTPLLQLTAGDLFGDGEVFGA